MNEKHNKIDSCRVCGSAISQFMTFGKMPIANGFLEQKNIVNEYFFELAPAFCDKCEMFQLIEQPAPEVMFHEHYAFYSSTSKYMQLHFKQVADEIHNEYLISRQKPLVVELGSNDGIFLHNFKSKGIQHLGIEPSKNVADEAISKGINTLNEFFSYDLSKKIIEDYGPADVVYSANVMCHIPEINDVANAISNLLKKDGLLIFEDPYLGDMINKTSYDQIYDEHVFIFSATSVKNLFGKYGLQLIKVQPLDTHGGSMRYYFSKNSTQISSSVAKIIEQEESIGLNQKSTYNSFKNNCEKSRENLVQILEDFAEKQKTVVGYAATSKSTTITNYCQIGPDLIQYISDTTPIKQGKLSPGMHIPVKPYVEFCKNYPDYSLLFAWNHAKEIFAKEQKYTEQGGKWITYVPDVKIIK